ncbi:MAG: ATP-dependent helicase, partial [Lachnospiraceae bacterium]|nr:ATP-dependent helicase [Lachnospiraceae bacterium]
MKKNTGSVSVRSGSAGTDSVFQQEKKNRETVNPEQAQAIRHKDGPMMVLAGPGSGKTFVITRRLRHMIEVHGIPPEEILVITFTKAAALEMQERFWKLMGDESVGVTFGTFHAVYFHILQQAYHYDASAIATEKEKRRYLKEAMSAHAEVAEDEQTYSYLLSAFSKIKNDGIAPEEYSDACCLVEKETFLAICHEYDRIMHAEGKLDFDDMVLRCRDLFVRRRDILEVWQTRCRYILIDEFQDINPMQYEVIRMLAAPAYNLFIVGDDDQSIYGFRGSAPEIMLGFPKEFPGLSRVLLKNNYRSTQGIVDSALRLAGYNKSRFAKQLKAQRAGKHDVTAAAFESKEEEAEAVLQVIRSAEKYMARKEIALLFRTNASARYYSQKLSAAGIPFSMKEHMGSVFSGAAGQDILAMYAYASGDHSRKHLLRFLNR